MRTAAAAGQCGGVFFIHYLYSTFYLFQILSEYVQLSVFKDKVSEKQRDERHREYIKKTTH